MKGPFARSAVLLLLISAALNSASAADALQRIQKDGVLKWGAGKTHRAEIGSTEKIGLFIAESLDAPMVE